MLAKELGWSFYDADYFHSAANIDKMRSGIPLTDQDRGPWLSELRQQIEKSLAKNENAVVACSALKKKYRAQLRVNDDVKFVYLRGDRSIIAAQLEKRAGHFFDLNLLNSQFTDLEEPTADESVITIDLGKNPAALITEIKINLQLPHSAN